MRTFMASSKRANPMSIPTTSKPIDHLGAMAPVVVGFLALGFVEAAIFHVKTRRGIDDEDK
jgi:hypothetical protein